MHCQETVLCLEAPKNQSHCPAIHSCASPFSTPYIGKNCIRKKILNNCVRYTDIFIVHSHVIQLLFMGFAAISTQSTWKQSQLSFFHGCWEAEAGGNEGIQGKHLHFEDQCIHLNLSKHLPFLHLSDLNFPSAHFCSHFRPAAAYRTAWAQQKLESFWLLNR